MEKSSNLKDATDKPSLRKTERSLPIALLRARETVMIPIRELLQESNISEQKWRVLRVVEEKGALEQTAIAEAACLLLPSLTRIVQSLEADGFLTRQPDSSDRRKTIVEITDIGRDLIAANTPKSNEIYQRLEKSFGKKKMNDLLDLLEELQHLRL